MFIVVSSGCPLMLCTAFEGGRGCCRERRDGGASRGSGQDQQVQPTTFTRIHARGRAQDKACKGTQELVTCAVTDRWNGQKDKEDLDEVSTELELADEDELIPYVNPSPPHAATHWPTVFSVTRSETPSSRCPSRRCSQCSPSPRKESTRRSRRSKKSSGACERRCNNSRSHSTPALGGV